MNIYLIALSAFAGSIVAAILGWCESQEPFIGRKFAASCLRGVISAVVYGAAYNFSGDITATAYFLAFLGGAGIDALGHRVASSIRNR